MKRNAILHGVTALCSALVFAFFALPYYFLGEESLGGYKFLDTLVQMQKAGAELPSKYNFALAAGIILLVVAGLAFVASVVLLLCDFEVIKNEMVVKVATWATLVLAGLLAVAVILNFVATLVFVGQFPAVAKAVAGWAMLIITTVLGLGACGTTAYAHFKK